MEPSGSVIIRLFASVSPSEDPSKVLSAAEEILGECAFQVEEEKDGFVLRSREMGCLQRIHDQFRDRHVRAAANRLLLKMRDGSTLRIFLNRQAATVGIAALCASANESPLGPLILEIESERPEALIDWLTAY